jgi:hypothetical protein
LYKDLCQIIVTSRLCGHAVAVNLKEFWEVFSETTVVREMPYFSCFTETVYPTMRDAAVSYPRGDVKVIFDSHPNTDHSAGLLYDILAANPSWEGLGDVFDVVSFDSRRRAIGIQVADLFTREAMKHMDNMLIGPERRRPRRSWEALNNTRRFRMKFMGTVECREVEHHIKSMGTERFNVQSRKYQEWLDRHRVTDSMSRRLEFVTQQRIAKADEPPR